MVGKNIVVIGGGMTAIDIAVQSKLLGAEQVTIAYRRSKNIMAASEYEQALAKKHDVQIQ
jgi:glutamate synthase (NADPH/NADH) small chain